MSARILLATRSRDKAREIQQILAALTVTIVSLDDAGLPEADEEAGIENRDSFLGNAHAKADYFRGLSGMATLADDSGISVAALDGAPGVHSKRYAHAPGLTGRALDEANNQRLLNELLGVPPENRGAHYTCAAVLHLPDGRRLSAVGTCSGTILEAPRGRHGFGYDPLFLDPRSGLSFAEMDPVRKNRISHRARAINALASFV